jgi:hypothetical protein
MATLLDPILSNNLNTDANDAPQRTADYNGGVLAWVL